jgi:hypothetical protein
VHDKEGEFGLDVMDLEVFQPTFPCAGVPCCIHLAFELWYKDRSACRVSPVRCALQTWR